MKKIAVLGCGTVGSGVVEVFYKNRSSIQKKSGCDMDIKYIYLRRAHPELLVQAILLGIVGFLVIYGIELVARMIVKKQEE